MENSTLLLFGRLLSGSVQFNNNIDSIARAGSVLLAVGSQINSLDLIMVRMDNIGGSTIYIHALLHYVQLKLRGQHREFSQTKLSPNAKTKTRKRKPGPSSNLTSQLKLPPSS